MWQAIQPLSGNLLALLTTQCFIQHTLLGDSRDACPAGFQVQWKRGTQSQPRVIRAMRARAVDTGLGTAQGMSRVCQVKGPIITQPLTVHSFTDVPHIARSLGGLGPLTDDVRVLELKQSFTLPSPNFLKKGAES